MKTIVGVVIVLLIAAAVFLFTFACPVCEGRGELEGTREISQSCPSCGGKGTVKRQTLAGASNARTLGSRGEKTTCLRCRGAGKVQKSVPMGACADCGGDGRMNLVTWFRAGQPTPK